MEVADVNFPHKPPVETQLMYVEDIKLLGPKQHVSSPISCNIFFKPV